VLLLSIIALFIGPLLYLWLRRGGFVAKAFDSVIVVILLLIMAFVLIPESWHALGYLAIALMLAGYLLPGLLEHLIKKAAHTMHLISLLLALAGLALHAMLDGAALTIDQDEAARGLSTAIVLHRFGMGLMLWMMVQPVFGRKWAFAILGFVSLATVAGYFLSESILGLEDAYAMSIIQAFIVGMLAHSLVHRSHGAEHAH
jgi:hypothetical protein